jgi:transcriptional regulator with XRE-family HTH domain
MNYEEIIKSWGWRLKKAGLNQMQFAKKAGVSQSAFSFWVNSARVPSIQNFQKVENALRDLGV